MQSVETLRQTRKGRNLEYLTVGWNSVEAVAAIGAGIVAGSVALVGFGFDSVIESLSGAVLLWRLFSGEHRERLALRLVGLSFLILAAYVGFDAGKSLWLRKSPETTYPGIAVAALSLVVMPLLARAKRNVAKRLNSRAMLADSGKLTSAPVSRQFFWEDFCLMLYSACGGLIRRRHWLCSRLSLKKE